MAESPLSQTTFYSRLHGTVFTMPSGQKLQFVGGVYRTSDPEKIKELTAAVKSSNGIQLSLTRVALKGGGDAHILKDVSNGTGAQSSKTVSALSPMSGK